MIDDNGKYNDSFKGYLFSTEKLALEFYNKLPEEVRI